MVPRLQSVALLLFSSWKEGNVRPNRTRTYLERCSAPERVRRDEEGHGPHRQVNVGLASQAAAGQLAQRHLIAELPRAAQGLGLTVVCSGCGA